MRMGYRLQLQPLESFSNTFVTIPTKKQYSVPPCIMAVSMALHAEVVSPRLQQSDGKSEHDDQGDPVQYFGTPEWRTKAHLNPELQQRAREQFKNTDALAPHHIQPYDPLMILLRNPNGGHCKLLTMLPPLPLLLLLRHFLDVPSLALSTPRIWSGRAVTPSSKAGLAWANGDKVDMDQFLGTGKVSW